MLRRFFLRHNRGFVDLVVVALIGFLPSPAIEGEVQFFGKMDADIQSVRTNQPGPGSASSRIRIASNASRFGAKGSIDLRSKLRAVWQIATRVNIAGAETCGGGGLFTLWGNSQVGLSGGFGTVFLGVWDTPFRQSYNKVDLFDNSHIASPIGLLGSIGNGVSGGSTLPPSAHGFPAAVDSVSVATTGFHRRQKSSLQYWSPQILSIQVKLAYSVDEPASKTATVDPSVLSLSATYDQGPLYVSVAHERHQDLKVKDGTNIEGIDYGTRLISSWNIADGKIGFVYEFLSFGVVGSGNTSRGALSFSGSYELKVHTLGAVYTIADDLSGASNTGADQISARYGYFLADAIELYGQCTAIHNGANATYNFGDGLAIATRQGANLSGFGVGLACSF